MSIGATRRSPPATRPPRSTTCGGRSPADSELPEVHLGLVRVYLATGKMREAKHHVERALRLDATHDEARKFAAMIERGPR